jgi:cytochrome c nitrite reductase small subunit
MASRWSQWTALTRRTAGWLVPVLVAVACGVLGGLSVFTFGYGEGYAYLGDKPETCANCHVMQESFDSWSKSSHHAVAVCNDCHTPHHSWLAKYITKADNGFFHSLAFTTGDFKDPIQIKERNSQVVQAACVDCHRDFVQALLPVEHEPVEHEPLEREPLEREGEMQHGGETLACVHCHASVGHAQTIAPRRYPGY